MEPELDNKKYCTLYIVRHGETDWNVKKKMQGQLDIPLNQNGIKQAQSAAKRLAKVKFDEAFSSDLSRARRTAEIITLEHKLTIQAHRALRERSFGDFQGKTAIQYRKALKDVLDQYEALIEKEKLKFKMPYGIENWEKVMIRFIGFLRRIAVSYPQKTVLIATHGGLIRHFLIKLGFADDRQLPWGTIENLATIKLLSDGVDFFVKETYGVNIKK
ncbi:MAG: histidine phosphatase family protein [Candidatus Beckwithbacteria bacterium]|nr:histidine phosphatase family protein [Patescibacteria group bacterium]